MYKATTFFTTLFSKLRVSDKEIRRNIAELYGEFVETILENVSENYKIQVLKLVTISIRDTINYLKLLQKNDQKLDPAGLKVLSSLVTMNKTMIAKIGLRTNRTSQADRILNEAFVADIGCDIGECVREFKKTKSLRKKINLLQRLKILLNNFNEVQQTELTPRDVLSQNSKVTG